MRPTTTSTTTTSTTQVGVTTTALPNPLYVQGSSISGVFGFLAGARRVAVPTIGAGASSAPLPAPGQPGYTSVEQLAFRTFGSGPPLLLVMGQDGSMTWWDPSFLSLLAQHYQVTIFDLPGIGYSAPPASPLTLDLMADDTAGLIQSLGLQRPTVLGWGLGGAVAVLLAERHPGSLGSLVLADAAIDGRRSALPAAAILRRLGTVWVTPTSLAGVMFSPLHHLEQAYWLHSLTSLAPDPVTHPAIAAEARLVAGLATTSSIVSELATISVPVLVVAGSADRIVPPADSSIIAARIPGARHIEYRGADFGAIFEQKSSFVATLEQFTG
jgi:pimeloyl-ACP methyl ester carboxylesterase